MTKGETRPNRVKRRAKSVPGARQLVCLITEGDTEKKWSRMPCPQDPIERSGRTTCLFGERIEEGVQDMWNEEATEVRAAGHGTVSCHSGMKMIGEHYGS